MTPTRQGSFRLFRLWGIDVHLHWTWFVLAIYSISERIPRYANPVWAVLEYGALFLIVLMHEFGHSLACRSVGGEARQIVLWPLGGVAYVSPPSRPGATLWSIAAGPLVNVVLVPVMLIIGLVCSRTGLTAAHPDLEVFLWIVSVLNIFLLGFNLLPIYPLDGGKILWSLLWFVVGKGRSLTFASLVGFVGGIGFAVFALVEAQMWYGVLALFLLMQCWQGFQEARMFRRLEKLPRRAGFSCPECHTSPPIGPFWRCQGCGHPFDLFEGGSFCPKCGAHQAVAPCVDCGEMPPIQAWDSATRPN
ncbi:MAG TPA: site-2 protease family protein [Opitutaceae bacterium]|nr:site-2 protease family protein [Opitutaceae bacterium]HND60233.1 site-2 protease family protein [Opitutaceae bacterium]